MLAYVGPSWGYVGLSWGQFGPILGLCWPVLGYVGPSWTHLRARLAHLGAMLAHLAAYVSPCWPIFSHKLGKWEKMGTGLRRHRRRPLSPSERREGKDTASSGPRGPLAGFKRLRATAGQGPMLRYPWSCLQDMLTRLEMRASRRIALSACSWSCLTPLSEPARNQLQPPPKCIPRLPKRTPPPHWSSVPVKAGSRLLVHLVVPNAIFWVRKKSIPKYIHTLPKRTPPPHWNSVPVKAGSRLRVHLAVPNAIFWVCKKSIPKCIHTLPKQSPPPHWNSVPVKAGSRLLVHLVVPNAIFWVRKKSSPKCIHTLPKQTPPWSSVPVKAGSRLQLVVPYVASSACSWSRPKKSAPKCIPRIPKRAPPPHWNCMPVKDGSRLPPAAIVPGCSWSYLILPNVAFWTQIARAVVSCPFCPWPLASCFGYRAALKQHASEGRIALAVVSCLSCPWP